MKDLISYLEKQKIAFSVVADNVVQINEQSFEIIYPTEDKLFDEDFCLITEGTVCDNLIFCFGGVWYFTPRDTEDKPQLNRVRFLGKSTTILPTETFLGIRAGYELLNGVGLYDEWIKKAKFLGVKTLGICEKNTLAGVMLFQNECIKNKIKPIIGATYTIYRPREDYKYDIKCYVQNEEGWTNLLMINKEVNVLNNRFVEEKRFFELTGGLSLVIDPKSIKWGKLLFYELGGVKTYYQLDSVVYDQESRDKEYLLNLKEFVEHEIPPIAITDAFYINEENAHLKTKLNQTSNVFEDKSHNQYFKTKDEYFEELDVVFKDSDRCYDFFQRALQNEKKLSDQCNFTIPQGQKHLPVYIMTEEEKEQFETNEDLFWHLILQGLQKKVPQAKRSKYLERVNEEVEVIELGGFIDYFLILWDIIKWCHANGILVGYGRGSSAGSLVSYLLNIVKVDPIEFDLMFERFLNRARVENGSYPDVDSDVSGSRKEEVKHYVEQRYGVHQVCSVGTYTTLQMKAALKDLARLDNIPPQDINRITISFDDNKEFGRYEEIDSSTGIFHYAVRNKNIMSFIKEHTELVNDALSLLNQPRSASIHACAMVVLPQEKDIFHWIPVKNISLKDGTTCLVSEWEGGEIESMGLLKEDILGLKQLDKIKYTLDLIKQNRDIDLDIYSLEYDDEQVYRYFRKGYTQDIFHFGAKGLTAYCKVSQPDNIRDLIAAIALYRPGPIESNLHNEYVLRKNGEKEIEYLWGTEEITRDTYGVLCYQEQIMRVCVDVGGFSPVNSDDVRRAMGKKKKDVLDAYKAQFIEGAVKNGCPQDEADHLWETLEKFSFYAFNLSHATVYAVTGYACQYLKVHYPIEFWTSSFAYISENTKEEDTTQFIAEINKTGTIKISPTDINKSTDIVQSDYKTNTIYWALNSVQQVGGIAVEQIITDRAEKGSYFSLEEFLYRHTFKGSKVNKSHIENLIYSGAFDQIENIDCSLKRIKLIRQYREQRKLKIDPLKDDLLLAGENAYTDWWWDLQQKKLSGIAFFDYKTMVETYLTKGDWQYLDQDRFQSAPTEHAHYIATGGYVIEVIERESKKKGKYCSIQLESNYEFLFVTIFPDHYKKWIEKGFNFVEAQGKLMLLSGIIKQDTFKRVQIVKIWDQSEMIILG